MDLPNNDGLNIKIQREVIDKHIYRDVKDTSKASFFWRKIANGSEASAKFLIATQGIISFGASVYDMPVLAFVSGSLSILSMALLQYGKYASNESKERTEELNQILAFKGITPIPNITHPVEVEDKQEKKEILQIPRQINKSQTPNISSTMEYLNYEDRQIDEKKD